MASGIVEPSQPGSEQQQNQQQNQPIARTRIVQRLLAASASLPNFIHDLILTQAHIVAGTEAAAFLIEPTPPQTEGGQPGINLKPVAHIRDDNSDANTRAAAIEAFQKIMQPCIEQGKDGAIHIDGSTDGSEAQYCLVTLLRSEGNVVAASAVVTRARDLERAQQRLISMQLVAGYFELFTLRRTSEQSRSIAQSHQHVLQLATAVGTADGFEAAAMNLCNELASRTGAARVSMGWVKGESIKLKAISHSEQFDKKQELSVQLVKVMEECLDNDEIVQFEPEGTSTNTVTRESQSLSRTQGGETILSLPLRRKGEIAGVVTLEFAPNSRIGPQAATGLAVAVDLLAPQLYDRFQNDRWLITKAGLSVRELGKKAIGPKYMLPKTVIALVLLAAAFVTFYRPMYHVKAPFAFVPTEKRAISAPFDGVLKKVQVRPGAQVRTGDLLLEFDLTQLELQKNSKDREAAAHGMDAARAQAEGKSSEAEIARARQQAAQAEADLAAEQMKMGRIVAPFDGEVLQGDLKDKVDSTFKQGEPLMEIGQLSSLRVEIDVAENDIQEVAIGKQGYIATTSRPDKKFPITVERIVPLSNPNKDGNNVFKVYATLTENTGDWRPGMKGDARLEVEQRRLVWIWTHRFTEFMQMKFWRWPFG